VELRSLVEMEEEELMQEKLGKLELELELEQHCYREVSMVVVVQQLLLLLEMVEEEEEEGAIDDVQGSMAW
jgi:hypothetical protein